MTDLRTKYFDSLLNTRELYDNATKLEEELKGLPHGDEIIPPVNECYQDILKCEILINKYTIPLMSSKLDVLSSRLKVCIHTKDKIHQIQLNVDHLAKGAEYYSIFPSTSEIYIYHKNKRSGLRQQISDIKHLISRWNNLNIVDDVIMFIRRSKIIFGCVNGEMTKTFADNYVALQIIRKLSRRIWDTPFSNVFDSIRVNRWCYILSKYLNRDESFEKPWLKPKKIEDTILAAVCDTPIYNGDATIINNNLYNPIKISYSFRTNKLGTIGIIGNVFNTYIYYSDGWDDNFVVTRGCIVNGPCKVCLSRAGNEKVTHYLDNINSKRHVKKIHLSLHKNIMYINGELSVKLERIPRISYSDEEGYFIIPPGPTLVNVRGRVPKGTFMAVDTS